jgi:hypothetical protein
MNINLKDADKWYAGYNKLKEDKKLDYLMYTLKSSITDKLFLELYKGKSILYLFDYGDMWQFMVNVVEIIENDKEVSTPEIIQIEGEAPQQYGY